MEELFELEDLLTHPEPMPAQNIGEPWEIIHINMQKALHGSYANPKDMRASYIEEGK
jgi:hypothetical protein